MKIWDSVYIYPKWDLNLGSMTLCYLNLQLLINPLSHNGRMTFQSFCFNPHSRLLFYFYYLFCPNLFSFEHGKEGLLVCDVLRTPISLECQFPHHICPPLIRHPSSWAQPCGTKVSWPSIRSHPHTTTRCCTVVWGTRFIMPDTHCCTIHCCFLSDVWCLIYANLAILATAWVFNWSPDVCLGP